MGYSEKKSNQPANMESEQSPRARRPPNTSGLACGLLFVAMGLVTLTGCGVSGSAVPPQDAEGLSGSVKSGYQPVSGSHLQLYAAGTNGTGSPAQPLLSNPVLSDSNGKFLIPANFSCPSQSSQIFAVASGGNPGLSSGTNNPALALTVMLGFCSSLSTATPITINEVTTVGSVWPLAGYMKSPVDVGSTADDSGFLSAVSSIPEFVNLAQDTSPGTPAATSYFSENSKLYSLADALANCASSSGGSAGDGSPCGLLFSMAIPPSGTAPTDTISAAMQIAQNPGNNVTGIFSLVKPNTPFLPTLTAAPSNWKLTLTYAVATPTISLGTGNYVGTQEVTITDSTAGSIIHYTTDGTVPTSSSSPYLGPLSIANSSTVQAIAVLEESQSAVASSTLTITSAGAPAKLAFLQQPSNTSTQAAISPAVQLAIEDASGNTVASATNPITVVLQGGAGLGGTLTVTPQNGIATFSNLTVSTIGSGYTLSATGPGLSSTISTTFTVSAPASGTNGTTVLASTPPSLTATPGGTFKIIYNWDAMPVPGQYSVFVNFIDSAGTIRFQDNAQPPIPISQWSGPVSYTHIVTVPSTTATGNYTIVAGLNSASGNLSIVAGPDVTSVGGGQYQIGTLILAPTCSITSFGAVGDGVTDNAAAIQNTFDYAASNRCIALIPAGTFAYSGAITATGIAVAGTGATSILAPLTLGNEALTLSGSGGSISDLVMVSTATERLTTPQSGMIWIDNATNYYVQNVLINNSSSVGIMSYNSSTGYILNNTIENTLADSITQINGSNNITVSGNRILNSGDDGISNNSYIGEPLVHDITVQGNTVLNNAGGRGLEVSGGNNISFTSNYVDNLDGFADVYIASESEWSTQGVNNVTATRNSLLDGGPDQGSLIIYDSQGSTYSIIGITVSGNQFVNPLYAAVEFAGNGSEIGIELENNTDYSTGEFSVSGNASATSTESGNQILAPSAYTTALAPAGGGCNFSGC